MYTGIIAALGRVVRCEGGALVLTAPEGFQLGVGDSFAVNGTCLTATRLEGQTLQADLSPETLQKTTLGALAPGEEVNLELPLRAGDALGGHFVQGHVDTVGRVVEVTPGGNSYRFTFQVDPSQGASLVEKGSVAVDGISLTACDVRGGHFSAAIIPHTYRHTTLRHKRVGSPVNVEFDVLGKTVEKLLAARLEILGGKHGL